jgi:hypothetical protein
MSGMEAAGRLSSVSYSTLKGEEKLVNGSRYGCERKSVFIPTELCKNV